MKRVLVVEDETSIREMVALNLKMAGWEVLEAPSAERALELMHQSEPCDAALLDIMLPGMDGLSLCETIRRDDNDIGIIIVSAKGQEGDKIRGLSIGADDYITKPFTLALVKMHIEAVLKRAGKLRTMVEYNDLQADVNAQLLFYKGQHIPTTRKEFDLMVYFMEHPGIVLPRDTILNAVWEYDYTGDVRTIDTLVKQLRKKMGEGCNYIRTVYGVGYIFGEDIHEN